MQKLIVGILNIVDQFHLNVCDGDAASFSQLPIICLHIYFDFQWEIFITHACFNKNITDISLGMFMIHVHLSPFFVFDNVCFEMFRYILDPILQLCLDIFWSTFVVLMFGYILNSLLFIYILNHSNNLIYSELCVVTLYEQG